MRWKIAGSAKAQAPLIVQDAPLLFMSSRAPLVWNHVPMVATLDTGSVKVSNFIN